MILCDNCQRDFQPYKASALLPSCITQLRTHDMSDVHWDLSLDEAKAELDRYDAEIARLEGLTRKLKKESLPLRRRYQAQYSLRAPIRRLPVEVLSIIFSMVCYVPLEHIESSLFPNENGDMRRIIAGRPYILSSVCSLWRRVMLSLGPLWSNVVIDLDDQADVLNEELDLVVGRCPKSLFRVFILQSESIECLTKMQKGGPFAKFIHGQITRIAEMYIFGTWDTLSMIGLSDIEEDPQQFFPNLRRFGLFETHENKHDIVQFDFSWIERLSFRDIQIYGTTPTAGRFVRSIHRSPDTITLYGHYSYHCTQAFETLAELKSVTLVAHDYDGCEIEDEKAVMPAVKELTIKLPERLSYRARQRVLSHMFLTLTAPSLVSLKVCPEESDASYRPIPCKWQFHSFKEFCSDSQFSSTLQHLDLQHICIKPEHTLAFISIFQKLPSLIHLTLRIFPIPSVGTKVSPSSETLTTSVYPPLSTLLYELASSPPCSTDAETETAPKLFLPKLAHLDVNILTERFLEQLQLVLNLAKFRSRSDGPVARLASLGLDLYDAPAETFDDPEVRGILSSLQDLSRSSALKLGLDGHFASPVFA